MFWQSLLIGTTVGNRRKIAARLQSAAKPVANAYARARDERMREEARRRGISVSENDFDVAGDDVHSDGGDASVGDHEAKLTDSDSSVADAGGSGEGVDHRDVAPTDGVSASGGAPTVVAAPVVLAPEPTSVVDRIGLGTPLTAQGFAQASQALGVDEAKLWAVVKIEARSEGFYTYLNAASMNRLPKILYERHWFERHTDGRYNDTAPDLSGSWVGTGSYGGGDVVQYDRLSRAAALDFDAALKSASWGLGQVMGFNHKLAGYDDVRSFVNAMCTSEDYQLMAMVAFIINTGLKDKLEAGDWAGFAKGYNGPSYARHKYHERLEDAYENMKRRGAPNLAVRSAQFYLSVLGYDPRGIDGAYGANTERAVVRYLESRGHDVADLEIHEISPALLAQLEDEALRAEYTWPLPAPPAESPDDNEGAGGVA